MSKRDQLLKHFALNTKYIDGKGDYLYYENEKGERVAVLDVVGSYGINLLGHKNEVVMEVINLLPHMPPQFVQAAKNPMKEDLCSELSNLMHQEFKKQWEVALANTGTEAVELALKLCLSQWQNKQLQWRQEQIRVRNYTLDNIQNESFIQEEEQPVFLYFDDSYHGKTLGSLSVMSNPRIRQNFFGGVPSIKVGKTSIAFNNAIEQFICEISVYNSKNQSLEQRKINTLAGIILEPIQGEGGVHMLPPDLLIAIANAQKTWGIPVISDEIQCGLYRTGTLSAISNSDLVADVYCFGKSLGAGLAKISAVCFQKNQFPDKLHWYHNSSFGEDPMGCIAALKFLQKMKVYNQTYFPLSEKLNAIKNTFPNFVKEIRGKGLMMAIELMPEAFKTSFITKFFADLDYLGYWLASVMLHREKIRILPTLSAPMTFRIQPSIHFSQMDFDRLIEGLENLFTAVTHNDLAYLFGHLFPISSEAALKPLPKDVKNNHLPEDAAVFICHPVDHQHLISIVDLVAQLPVEVLDEIIEDVRDDQEFTVYHTDVLQNNKGEKLNIVFLGIPLTSMSFFRALRSGKRDLWIEKIQRAIDWANERNARSIGLGQFTSIITASGMDVHSKKAVLTTGNSYTAKLAVDAVSFFLKNQNIKRPSIGIIGAAGNIASVITDMLLEHSHEMVLVFRKKASQEEFLPSNSSLETKAKLYNTKLTYTINIEDVKTCDVVVLGTNHPGEILMPNHVKEGALILDIAVPPNASEALRESHVVIQGGMAALPLYTHQQEQYLDSVILPFGIGECYACMAETFGLGFENLKDKRFTGNLSTDGVAAVATMVEKHGFGLKRLKTERSV